MALFVDVVQGPGATAAAVANRVKVGTLTLKADGNFITRVWATAAVVGTYAANKPLVGYIQLESNDANIEPFEFPIEPVPSYITLGGAPQREAHKWPCNCPIKAGGSIDVYMVADVAPNAAPEIQCNIEYSNGGGGGEQLHMAAGEPAVAQSTSDNGETALTNITEAMGHLYALWAYGVFTTPVADSAVTATLEVKSNDFMESGPLSFSINPNNGGDANTVASFSGLTLIETDRMFKSSGAKATVKCTVTMRDAVSTAPLANWGVVYSE